MTRLLTSFSLICVLGGCAATTAASAQAASPPKAEVVRTKSLTVEDVVDLRSVREVAISPDAKHVAYTLRVPATASDGIAHGHSVIWIVPTRGGEPRRYTVDDVNSRGPAWSPDGRWL